MTRRTFSLSCISCWLSLVLAVAAAGQSPAPRAIVLHAARLLDVKTGRMIRPGEVLVEGERIVEVGPR